MRRAVVKRLGVWILPTALVLVGCSIASIEEEQSTEKLISLSDARQSASVEPQDFAAYADQVEHLPPASSADEYMKLYVEALETYAICMEERGWSRPRIENPYTEFMSIVEEVAPQGLEAEKFKDEKDCLDHAAPWPTAPLPTRESVSEEYDRMIKFRQCVIDNGGSISELPTREKHIEDVLTGGIPWTPMAELRKSGFWAEKRQEQIYDLCPW